MVPLAGARTKRAGVGQSTRCGFNIRGTKAGLHCRSVGYCRPCLHLPRAWWNGRHRRLKIFRPQGRAGSSPAARTNQINVREKAASRPVCGPVCGAVFAAVGPFRKRSGQRVAAGLCVAAISSRMLQSCPVGRPSGLATGESASIICLGLVRASQPLFIPRAPRGASPALSAGLQKAKRRRPSAQPSLSVVPWIRSPRGTGASSTVMWLAEPSPAKARPL